MLYVVIISESLKMAIEIEMLRCFQAAAALVRTPSAVSMMLAQFEDHIGEALFQTARKSRLTPLGDLILAEAQRE
jgi:DNA-binding transcriptional LysR family regulator